MMHGATTTGQMSMHECLRLPEIRAEIFNLLHPGDCAVLSRSCKLFYNEAMDVVWAELPSLLPLIRCMPSNLLRYNQPGSNVGRSWQMSRKTKMKADISFERDPTPEDWMMFSKYAQRVKRLTLPHNQVTQIRSEGALHAYALADTAMAILAAFIREYGAASESAQSTCLFPKLVVLNVVMGVQVWFPNYVSSLCGLTLRSCTLTCDQMVYHTGDPAIYDALPDILPSFVSKWPNLRSLRLTNKVFAVNARADGTFVPKLDAWLSGLTQLQSLDVYAPINASTMRSISQLPELRELHFVDETGVVITDDPSTPLSPPGFPLLHVLELTVHYPDSPISVLHSLSVPSTPLRTLRLCDWCMVDDPGLGQRVAGIFEAISHMRTLECLHIEFTEVSDTEWRPDSRFILSGKLLSMLYPLRQLKELQLEGFSGCTIADDDLAQAASSWPNLEEIQFQIQEFPYNATISAPHASLAGIQALYNGCPNMKGITLASNDKIPTTNGVLDIPPAKPRRAMRDLSLTFRSPGDLGEASCAYVPMLVSLMFPELETFTPWAYDVMIHDWDLRVADNWQTYKSMAPADVRALLLELVERESATGDRAPVI